MKIQDKDYYHGSAITQIVEHESFTALNKADEKYGHYIVNHDIRLFVKYSTDEYGPWSFTFQSADLTVIQSDFNAPGQTFICLVCGLNTICVLRDQEAMQAIDLSANGSQWIKVTFPPGGSMRVWGQLGSVSRTIPHNAFPDIMFE